MDAQKKKPFGLTEFIYFAWAIIALLVWIFRNIQPDDAYITYRYARHISIGLGFSYNPPQLVLGTTTPLYTLILALFAWLGMDIPTVSLILSGLGLAAIIWVLVISGIEGGNASKSFLPAALLILLPGSYLILGMETLFYTAFIYICIYFLSKKNFIAAIIFASIATLTRYDGILVTVIILMAEWYFTRSIPLKSCFIYTGLLTPWIIYATLTFGSALPNTFFAKTGSFETNVFIDNLGPEVAGLFAFTQINLIGGYIVSFVMIILLAWSWLVTRNIFVRLTIIWGALYLAAYSILGIRYHFHWYYYPILPAFLVSITTNIKWLQTRLEEVSKKTSNFKLLVNQLPFLLIILPMFTIVTMGTIALNQQNERLASIGGRNIVYPLAAQWICAHTDPTATILTPEIGLIGWNCDRTIIDPYGLVTPEMIPYIRAGDRITGEASMRPDSIVIPNVNIKETPTLPSIEIFQDTYQLAKVITDNRYPYQLVIFSKAP